MFCRRADRKARIHAAYHSMNIVKTKQSGESTAQNRFCKIKAGSGRKILCAGSGKHRQPRFYWTARQNRLSEAGNKTCRMGNSFAHAVDAIYLKPHGQFVGWANFFFAHADRWGCIIIQLNPLTLIAYKSLPDLTC